jgi:cell division protein FtsB
VEATPTPEVPADKKMRSEVIVGIDQVQNGFNPHLLADDSAFVQSLARLVLPSAFVDGELNRDLLSEVNLLQEDVREGEEGLVKLRNTLSEVDMQMVEAQGRATRITEEIDRYEALIAGLRRDGFTEREDIEALKAEIQSLEQEVKKLREAAAKESGSSAREFIGDGNRQYLTGINLGGRNIAILLDVSASMLADKLVNIIRMRNMGDEVRRGSAKWQRALAMVEWLAANLPVTAKYQIVAFNTRAEPVLGERAGGWLEAGDVQLLDKAVKQLRQRIPQGGTSLHRAFSAAGEFNPAPDNILLITDGLPTQGREKPKRTTVSAEERLALFEKAVERRPKGVPVNTILLPMEGDAYAAAAFWQLAVLSGGAFLTPSKDWP